MKIFYKRSILIPTARLLAAFTAVSLFSSVLLLPAREAKATAAEMQGTINDLQTKTDDIKEEINNLDSQLVSVLTSIETLENDIAETEQEIADTEVELAAAQASVEKQYGDMKKRIKYMYERGDDNFLEMLLESGSITDFLNRAEYITSVYDYDRDLLNAYNATQKEISDMKVVLESDKISLEAKREELAAKESSLNALIDSKKNELSDFETQLAAAKKEAERRAAEEREKARLAELEKQKKEAEKKAREERERQERERQISNGNSSGGNSSSGNSGGSSSGDSGNSGGSGNSGNSGGSSNASDVSGGSRNPSPVTNVSGSEVVSYAKQFVGNPYVWGGNSLTDGCDCSGFVVQVYKHFGINLSGSRYSEALRGVGQAVDYENIQPGDIVCYSGHVAIYAGGGVIVEAQSTKAGITCSRSVTCKKILAIRRVI